MKLEELKRYILMLREEEMNNNYKLSEEQIALINKVNGQIKTDPKLKAKLDRMLNARSNREINAIENGIEVKETKAVDFVPQKEEVVEENKVVSFQEKKGKQLVLTNNRRAGYIDALVMALVTGFVGGIATTILLMMCQR